MPCAIFSLASRNSNRRASLVLVDGKKLIVVACSLLPELQSVISITTTVALASFSKALSYSIKAMKNGDAASADMIRACRSMWSLRDWLAASSDEGTRIFNFDMTLR